MGEQSAKKTSLLSGSKMLEHHAATYEVNAQFNRMVSPDELDEQRRDDLTRMQDELRHLLEQERVNKTGCISEGVWENDQRRVRLTLVEGKWQSFGYENATGKYVDCHEALFLMEMNRLMVKWDGIVVSIEQGYSLFLGFPDGLTLEEYQVYSVLNRAGYYVLRYDPGRVTYQSDERDLPSVEERCVWSILYGMLNQPNPRESVYGKTDSKLQETVRRSMLHYRKLIRTPCSMNGTCNATTSRATNSTYEPVPKKPHLGQSYPLEDQLDSFKVVERFRRMFERFDIIRSMSEEESAHSNELPTRDQQLIFDLFSSDAQSFKKTLPPLPIARILVRRSCQPMPSFKELEQLYQAQQIPTPLMLMLVSNSLAVNCFLYDMRTLSRNTITLTSDHSSPINVPR
ncbi:uncharacterized protein LOC131213535 [Anopheles bellator]|uniref:uncharacterized protein LOC131213535 n=1 Tax=Anopheles bellator TaxID=139047 RepID=UPI002649A96E|nr:uncharacterized protein LOC131213535 [Anopheles bellator]